MRVNVTQAIAEELQLNLPTCTVQVNGLQFGPVVNYIYIRHAALKEWMAKITINYGHSGLYVELAHEHYCKGHDLNTWNARATIARLRHFADFLDHGKPTQ